MLSGAQMFDVALLGSSFRGCDFSRCRFDRASELRETDFTAASFRGADLADANVRYCCFQRTDFTEARLGGVTFPLCDLRDTVFTGAELPHFQIVPETGAFVGYKRLAGGVICTLRIPDDARRTGNLVDRKCRASHADVLDGEGTSVNVFLCGDTLTYRKGERVAAPNGYSDDFRTSAGAGVHFFITRREAEEYLEGGHSPVAGWGDLPTLGTATDYAPYGWPPVDPQPAPPDGSPAAPTP